jgi:hypothetical protein
VLSDWDTFKAGIPREGGYIWGPDLFAAAWDWLVERQAWRKLDDPENVEDEAIGWTKLVKPDRVNDGIFDQADQQVAATGVDAIVLRLMVAVDRAYEGFAITAEGPPSPAVDTLLSLWGEFGSVTKAADGLVVRKGSARQPRGELATYCRNLARIDHHDALRVAVVPAPRSLLANDLRRARHEHRPIKVAFVPVLTRADDAKFEPVVVGRAQHFAVRLRNERQLELQAVSRSIVRQLSDAGVTIALLPEQTLTPKSVESLRRAMIDQTSQCLRRGVEPPLKLAVVGVQDDRFNEAWVIDCFGNKLMVQRKMTPWEIQAANLDHYGLTDELKPPANRTEDLTGSGELVVLDVPGARLIVLICEDMKRCDPAQGVAVAAEPTIVVGPVLDGGLAKERWAWAAAAKLADQPGALVVVVNSLVLDAKRRASGKPTDPLSCVGIVMPPRDPRGAILVEEEHGAMFVTAEVLPLWIS